MHKPRPSPPTIAPGRDRFQDCVWKTTYFSEGETPAHNIWHWVAETEVSHGAAVSVSWYRRSEADVREIGRALLDAMAHVAMLAA